MTFADLSQYILSLILAESKGCDRVDMVFDVYKDGSIKDAERVMRGSEESTHFKNIAPGHNVQQWRTFLRGSENKRNLIKFLVSEWKQPKQQEKIATKQFLVTCEDKCFSITKDGCEEIDELRSSQEEADTR